MSYSFVKHIGWTTECSSARALFCTCIAGHLISDALRGFRERRLDTRKADVMLQRETDVVTEATEIIATDELDNPYLLVAVWKLRGAKSIAELVHEARLDRRQRLHKRCRGASTHAELMKHSLGGPDNLPSRTCAGTSADDAGV